jgi:hypothetical protein
MLGQLLSESRGRITGQRVLSVENGTPKFEISITGTRVFKGSFEVTTSWTYWAIQRSDKTSYSQRQGIILTRDGRETATATGRTEGKMIEPGKMRYVGAIFYETNSKNKLASLNT